MAVAIAVVLAVAIGLVLLVSWSADGSERPAAAPTASPSPRTASVPPRFPAAPADMHRFPLPDPDHRLMPDADDLAIRTRTTGPLLLFLPATGEQPSDYRRLLTVAGAQGYHVLGLDYFNLGQSVSATCQRNAACYGELERNRFDGSHPFSDSRVDPANSILTRTEMALDHLDAADPHGGWNAYQHDGAVQWQDVVVAGHSQGGGIAAWIAHTRRVRGVIMFGSPIVTDGPVSASWLHTPSATPASREYAFDSSHDVFFTKIEASWQLLGLGAHDDVTDGGQPHGHALVTTLLAPHAHIGMAADSTPLGVDGQPVYLPVWTWMLQRFA